MWHSFHNVANYFGRIANYEPHSMCSLPYHQEHHFTVNKDILPASQLAFRIKLLHFISINYDYNGK